MILHHRDNRGFALLAVFWIALLLGMLALNYATTARLNAEAARNRRLGAERDYLLQSAIAKGYHEYLKYRANRSRLNMPSPRTTFSFSLVSSLYFASSTATGLFFIKNT